METEISSLRKSKRPHGFMTLLSLAVCEWFLMLLLFVNAALAYLVTKFAHHCGLNTPCLFCSRLECGLKRRQPGFYWNLLCSDHKEEISCMMSCSIHEKFADVNGMCEECLAPIVAQSRSKCGSYSLLLGKKLVDVDKSVLQTLLLNKSVQLGSHRKMCSCCRKPWKAKTNAARLLELNSAVNVAAKANVKPPLPRIVGRSRFCRRDSLKRLRDKYPEKKLGAGSSGGDDALRGGNRCKKISSHSDTEVLLSDDECTHNIHCCETYSEPDCDAQCDPNFPLKAVVDKAVSEKALHQGTEVKPQPYLLDKHGQKNVGSLSSDALSRSSHNWEFSNNKSKPSPDLISFDDGGQQPSVAKDSFGVLAKTSNSYVPLPEMREVSRQSELLSLTHTQPVNNATTTPMKTIVDSGGTCETEDASAAKDMEAAAGTSLDGSCSLESTNMHPIDASSQSDKFIEILNKQALEQTNACDSSQAEEHLRSQPHAYTSDSSEVSKDNHPLVNDGCTDHDSGLQGPLILAMMMKNDSKNEVVDGITLSDIDGESIIDKLKRQIALDQSTINSLRKELEEERNAASIAAKQAMAMITRLQEEKATLHMEALQYLRMMEEQAEYDMEALARANDLLAEREKELQDLEYELDFYRENAVASEPGSSTPAKISKAKGNGLLTNSSVSPLENTKAYISQCLNNFEKKLHQSGRNGNSEKALEADYNVLKCATYSILREKDGSQFMQEIAHELQDLQKCNLNEMAVHSSSKPAQALLV